VTGKMFRGARNTPVHSRLYRQNNVGRAGVGDGVGDWLLSSLICAAVTAGLSLVRSWLRAIVVVVTVAIGLLAAWPSSFDEHIVGELEGWIIVAAANCRFYPICIGAWAVHYCVVQGHRASGVAGIG
jgi:hypothetical protein